LLDLDAEQARILRGPLTCQVDHPLVDPNVKPICNSVEAVDESKVEEAPARLELAREACLLYSGPSIRARSRQRGTRFMDAHVILIGRDLILERDEDILTVIPRLMRQGDPSPDEDQRDRESPDYATTC
jgi:hypothetical protein